MQFKDTEIDDFLRHINEGKTLSSFETEKYSISQISLLLFEAEGKGLIVYDNDDRAQLTEEGQLKIILKPRKDRTGWIEPLKSAQIKRLDLKSIYLPSLSSSKKLNQ